MNSIVLSFSSPKTPLVGERWDYQGQHLVKSQLHSLQCRYHGSPDQKAVQEIVSVTDDWIKSARMSSVKIMVSSHLVESVQQARKERFMLQDSVEKYAYFVFPDSLECVKP